MDDNIEFLKWLIGALIAAVVGGFAVLFLVINYRYRSGTDVKLNNKEKVAEAKENMEDFVKREVAKTQKNLEGEVKVFHEKLDSIKNSIGFIHEHVNRLNGKTQRNDNP